MADLIRTVDQDGVEDEREEDGPVLAKAPRGLFSDLVSDDEEDARVGGWDFETQHATEETGPQQEIATGLAAKIRARLEERGEDEAQEPPKKKKKGKKAQAAAAVEEPLQPQQPQKSGMAEGDKPVPNASHLSTGMHFADLRLSRPLLRALADLKFESPTPIQRDVIPPALQGLDVLATAETGSGKTASFLLPALERLCQSQNVRSRKVDATGRIIAGGRVATKSMVLLPTRELAVQCHAMLRDLAKFTMVTYNLVAGGFVSNDQASALRQQPDIVVATPGRMLDHLLNSQSVHMELLEIVVFDEADRLLEMGFREECMQVLKCCSKGRQTMLFSATLNTSVEDLAKFALIKPVRIKASPVNRVAETLEQEFVKAPSEGLREAVLLSLCTRVYQAGVIVFCSTRKDAHRLAMIFGLAGLNFAEIHGNLSQTERVQALSKFQRREANFLLATDLAARGLDLNNVDTVINFQLPLDASRYIHRVGRTARMGRTGRAVTIYTPSEYSKVKSLGKQCCSKVKSTVLKRTVAGEAIEAWDKKIKTMEEDISAIDDEEKMERELRLADIYAGKSDNLQKHKAAINGRPAKTWYMSNFQKKLQKEQEVEDLAQKAEQEEKAAVAQEERKLSKKQKKELERNDPAAKEARRLKRIRDKAKERKALEMAQRGKDEKRMRMSARKNKSKFKAGKAGAGAEKKQKHVKGKPGKQKSGKQKKKKGGKR